MSNIRLCKPSELNLIQDYIEKQWDEKHVFVLSEELLNWQHTNKSKINFVITENENKDILGILGFIPLDHFDPTLKKNGVDVWAVMWKAHISSPGVGVAMLRYVEELLNPVSVGAIGNSGLSDKLFKILQFKSGILNQYYYLNPKIENFQIALIPENTIQRQNSIFSKQKIIIINDLKALKNYPEAVYAPYKSINYIVNRYCNHPVYKYGIWEICDKENNVVCLWVIRKIKVKNSHCIRIVDVLGDLSKVENLSSEFDILLNENNSEYIDFINYGISEDVFYKIGFQKRTDNIIIPNYFEPFIRQNIDIKFAYKSQLETYTIFKGDSDQDRPSILRK